MSAPDAISRRSALINLKPVLLGAAWCDRAGAGVGARSRQHPADAAIRWSQYVGRCSGAGRILLAVLACAASPVSARDDEAGSPPRHASAAAATADARAELEREGGNAATSHPVGQFPPNNWGLHDMHGNVFEWCSDWYAAYSSGPLTDPNGPPSGTARVFRGGSFCNLPHLIRSAFRGLSAPTYSSRLVGLRVVCDLPATPAR